MSDETNAEKLKRLRYYAKQAGFCYVCRCRTPRPGVSSCDHCIALTKARQRKHVERGGCAECRLPRVDARHCERHRIRANAADRERRALRVARGMCSVCNKPRDVLNRNSCSECLAGMSEVTKRIRDTLRGGPSTIVKFCSVCGVAGHDKRRHNRIEAP